MKVKTSELTPQQLNAVVSNIEGHEANYATDWAHGGPIIEEEGIGLHLWSSEEWIGDMGDWEARDPTPLVAAMRCYVASKLGDEVDVSDELTETV